MITTTDLAGELMGVTAGIRRQVRRQLRQAMTGPPLPPAQVELLIVIDAEPGIGVAAAARTLHLAGNSVSGQVNILVAAGLLRREIDPDDRRAARLYPTQAARLRLAHWRASRTELVGRALDRIGPTDRETIEQALPALRRLMEAMS